MEEKVYTPIETQDAAFPLSGEATFASSEKSAGEVYSPKKTTDNEFPKKAYAVELISTVLNTRSKKILGEFQFTPSGALQIGDYTLGQSGDVRISPDGVVARNSAGLTTFALDGTTGSAVFSGEIQSGTLVTGRVVIGNNKVILDTDGITVNQGAIVVYNDSNTTTIDNKGVVSSANFTVSGANANSLNQLIGSGDADITGSSMTFTLTRARTILFLATVNANMAESVGNTGNGYVFISIDGTEYYVNRMIWASSNDTITNGCTFVLYANLAAGSHTIKLVGHQDILTGSTSKLNIYSFNFAYTQLGT